MPTDLPDDSCNYITNIGKIIYKQTDKQPKIINNFEYCEKSIITIKESPFDHYSENPDENTSVGDKNSASLDFLGFYGGLRSSTNVLVSGFAKNFANVHEP